MTEVEDVRTVLIVDYDLAFVLWLSQLFFSLRAVNVIPARDSSGALAMSTALNLKVDLLLVNSGLSGVERLIKSLEHRDLRIIAIADEITLRPVIRR